MPNWCCDLKNNWYWLSRFQQLLVPAYYWKTIYLFCRWQYVLQWPSFLWPTTPPFDSGTYVHFSCTQVADTIVIWDGALWFWSIIDCWYNKIVYSIHKPRESSQMANCCYVCDQQNIHLWLGASRSDEVCTYVSISTLFVMYIYIYIYIYIYGKKDVTYILHHVCARMHITYANHVQTSVSISPRSTHR